MLRQMENAKTRKSENAKETGRGDFTTGSTEGTEIDGRSGDG
jgi:hypothetical protein